MKSSFLILLISTTFAAQAAEVPSYRGLGATSISTETLEAFRAKALPPDLSRKVQSMLDLRGPGAGILSPDGKAMYYGWRVTGTPQVWRVDGAERAPMQMTGGEDATAVLDISPDGKWLILSRDRKGEENPGLYLQATAGGELKPIQHLPGIQTLFEFVSDDGRYVYYRSNDEVRDSYTFYRYELGTAKKEKLFDRQGSWNVVDHQADGTLLLQKSFSNVDSEIWEWSPTRKDFRPVLGQGEGEDYRVQYGAKPGELVVLTSKFDDARRLYKLVDGKFSPITPAQKWDVARFSFDQAKQRLYYAVNEAGYAKSYALDAKTLQPLKLPTFPGADHVQVLTTSQDGQRIVLGVESAALPNANYVFDWKSHKLTRWVAPSTPEVDTKRFTAARLESYPSRDGQQIPMFVQRPAKCEPGPCPVVVQFHGGPEGQSRPGFSTRAQLFVDAGFIYVQPNVRGSDGYGKTWLNADNGPKRLDVITDIEDAAIYIKKAWAKNGVAPKVGIMGGSYGGYSTLYAMTRFAGAYDAGVATVGMSNLLSFLENTAPYRRALRAAEYGDPTKDREALIALSPITYIDKLKDPLLIIQGVSDPRVPVGEAVQMYEAAQKRGVASELILFADEGHGATKRENQVMSIGHTLRFFETYLKR
ncbi:S9 family peptidase [Chitinimonas sp. PSY-7]|uniref:prolyl oligopeptidase family serine peptidase n=1 Tax=Chitinimonas sp. PSY-7 TaxID=3459088 RepID=UPI00403FD075